MRLLLGTLNVGIIALSPVVLYLAATRLDVRPAAAVVGGFIGLRLLVKLSATPKSEWGSVLGLPLVAFACAALGGIVRDPRLLLVFPALTQFAFAATFLLSLRSGSPMPLVERFARLEDPALSDEKIRYCRSVTTLWGAYLVVLGAASLGVAVYASREAWAIFTGIFAYVFIAALFSIELAVRQIRFRADRRNPVQRLLFRLFREAA